MEVEHGEAPYLISDGAELAYLAQQVNNGNYYEGQYFQLACDINLGNQEWTPIGDTDNSFRGIFDGAGHTIANGKITITEFPGSYTYHAYGLFGSIGGGSTRTIVRNLEVSDFDIDLDTSGTASNYKGIHIGIIVGNVYNNASIVNNIAKNSNITDSTYFQIRNSYFQLAVGGIAGFVANDNDFYYGSSDPGTEKRYLIENCFSDTQINLNDITVYYNKRWNNVTTGKGQFHCGGIIGTILAQPIWPSNCLYSGSINSQGFIGPIFGGLIDGTSYTAINNFPTIWNGNDAGNLTVNNAYYTNYSASGRAYTQTVTSGTSTNMNSTTQSNTGYVQGLNKGIYTNNMTNMLNMFNGNVSQDNKYVNWLYENDTFTFKERLTTTVKENVKFTYDVEVNDPYEIGTYTVRWYKNGELDTSIQGLSYAYQPNYENDEDIIVVTHDGEYYTVTKFIIKKVSVNIAFTIDQTNNTVVARLEGDGLYFTSEEDYTFQWYKEDIAGEGGAIDGANALILDNLEEGMEYKLIGTNNRIPQLSAENSFIYGDRIVVYVKYNGGSNYNDGFTPETPVEDFSTAYSKLDSNGSRNKNIIVLMDDYEGTEYLDSANSTEYNKKATITGKYKGNDYNPTLNFEAYQYGYRYLNADTTFMYLNFSGLYQSWYGSSNSQTYFYLQGYSLTIGEDVEMVGYSNSNPNQGLLGSNAPAFHIICGWLQYNYRTLPRNNSEVLIKSGTYARIIGGGSPGTSSGQGQTTSHDFMGSSMEDSFKISITIDIQNSTKTSQYDYDVNLLTGGSACGNNHSRVTENIKNGTVGRVLGGSIGDSQRIPNNWRYPNNTFLGETTINVTGGTINELYGGCLGRNMGAINSNGTVNTNYTGNTCDSYFYGNIDINIQAGEITNNIYGAGAGGVTGYNENSSDPYKSYGESFDTSVNIKISGGTIGGNIYGGGYGFTEYLNANVTATDGGALYGDSNIIITDSPTIQGNIYAAGCGYDYSRKPEIAKMTGTSNIDISGTPTINGQIFGAGAGVAGYDEMAKLTGTSNIKIASNLGVEVYGGGNIAKTSGTTNINIESGNHTADIYGGGNLGIVEGTANVNINGGTSSRAFGGGNQAAVTNSIVNINGGNTNEVYGGGNSASVDETKVYLKGGTANTIYGGSNQTGTVKTSNIETTTGTAGTIYGGNNIGGTTEVANVKIDGSSITTAVYGGGNQVDTGDATVYLNKADNTIPNVFGGGNQAVVPEPYVYCNGANVTNVFGGSNANGTVTASHVEVNAGNIENTYGGNNQGGTTTTTNVGIKGGNIVNVYGGGDQALSTTSNVNITSGNIINIYGGGNQAGVTTTNVTTNGGNIENIFGGSNKSGNVSESYVTTNNVTGGETTSSGGVGMNVTANASSAQEWQSTTYPTVATINVTLTNSTQTEINNWTASIYAPNSTLFSNYSQSEITENNGNYTMTQRNRYSNENWEGVNAIPANGSYSIEFTILSMKSVEEFSVGYNLSGSDTDGNSVSVSTSQIENVYGGNNLGGTTGKSNVTINSGRPNRVYGGGNQAVTNETNVQINGEVKKNVFGGGNQAGVNTNTNVNLTSATVGDNVYGGGDEGTVTGNTNVHIKNSTLKNSLYAGGNGTTAIVYGNTNLIMDGTSNQVTNSVFGGGNKAATGSEDARTSTSTVNIVGGKIGKNVYGGANTSVVYGVTKTNIGYDTINDTSLEKGDIEIGGTVFGGGEANESGSENYDFEFISVTNGIDIQIDGNGYDNFSIKGSIFGSGNASSTSGESYIYIKNYGTADEPQSNISIQRANCATIDNSAITLSGATDRTNEYSSTFFSISRVDEVKVKNNSTLYLCNGANLLKKLDSLVDENGSEIKGSVQIDGETGDTTRNVDNRIYMLEGKNLNIATNEQVTAYGQVYGMFFFGLFTNRMNPSTSTGFYHNGYNNGDIITNVGTFSSNSYAMAEHMANHNLEEDGFYTNYNEEGIIKTNYIDTTPKDDVYYIWLVGEKLDVTVFELSLTASKYATLGTYELLLQGFSDKNIKFSLIGFSAGLANGISLVDPDEIQSIEQDETKANSQYGLTMKTGNNGWQTKGSTTFLTKDGGSYTGRNDYNADNSTYTPTLNFCLYHSQNITVQQALGDVKIRLQVQTPIDDLNYKLSYIDINITMMTALYQNDFYEAAITPGQEFRAIYFNRNYYNK